MGTLWRRPFQNVKNCQVSCCYVVAVSGRATLSASGCPPKAIGAAWLRPQLFCRIPSNSKHSSKAAARVYPSSLPAVLRKCCQTSPIWFVRCTRVNLSDLRFPRNYFVQVLHVKQPRICSIIGLILFMADKPNHIALVSQHLRKAAGREDVPPLAAALEECLEALSILQNNQGRSQAAPLAASRQRTRWRDRPQPQRTSRILRDSQHSGTDAARGWQSSLPASLLVKIYQSNSNLFAVVLVLRYLLKRNF